MFFGLKRHDRQFSEYELGLLAALGRFDEDNTLRAPTSTSGSSSGGAAVSSDKQSRKREADRASTGHVAKKMKTIPGLAAASSAPKVANTARGPSPKAKAVEKYDPSTGLVYARYKNQTQAAFVEYGASSAGVVSHPNGHCWRLATDQELAVVAAPDDAEAEDGDGDGDGDDDGYDLWVICEGCECEHRLLDLGLAAAPEGDWYCNVCERWEGDSEEDEDDDEYGTRALPVRSRGAGAAAAGAAGLLGLWVLWVPWVLCLRRGAYVPTRRGPGPSRGSIQAQARSRVSTDRCQRRR
jgi:hypothetical protein